MNWNELNRGLSGTSQITMDTKLPIKHFSRTLFCVLLLQIINYDYLSINIFRYPWSVYSSAQWPSYHSLPWVVRGGGIFFIFIGLRIVLIITVVIVIVRWSYDLNIVVRVGDLSIVYWWSVLGSIRGAHGCRNVTVNLQQITWN